MTTQVTMEDIEKVVVNLLTNRDGGVFYASLISQMRRIPMENFPACAGVTVRNGRIELYYNPKIFAEMLKNNKERIAVLEHEVQHLVKNHLARRGNRDPQLFNIACVPGDTLILGPNIPISEVKPGMKTFQTDGKFSIIDKTMSKPYKGELIEIIGSSLLSAKFTPEHPIRIYKKKYKNHYPITLKDTPCWVNANEVEIGDYLLIPKLTPSISNTSLSLEPFIESNSNNRYKESHNIKPKLRSKILNLTESLAWTLGFYTADGSLNTRKKEGLNFSLHPDNDKKNLVKLKKFFRYFGYKTPVIDSEFKERYGFYRTATMLKISSSILAKAFTEWCGRGSTNKKIPDFILNHTNKKFVKAFLDGYFEGDGCDCKKKRVKYKVASTVSRVLASQLQLAILRLGDNNWASILKAKNSGLGKRPIYRVEWRIPKSCNRKVGQHKVITHSYRWKEKGDYFIVPVRKIKKSNYKGRVYNLQTKTHTFTVSNFVTHNCDIAINQNIKNLPDWVCQWDKYPKQFKMESNKSAEWYFERLKQNSKSITITQNKDGSYDVEVKDGQGKTTQKFKMEAPGGHTKWEKGSDSPEVVKEVIKQTVEKAIEQTERMQGRIPGSLEADIAELRQPPIIPWHVMLKRWVANRIKAGSRYSWKRPNRRFGSTQKGRVPTRKLAIAVAFDTSGSISDNELEIFLNEVKAIMECYKSKFLIMEIDHILQKSYDLTPFAKIQKNIKGRGGTSFKPAFEHIEEKNKQIDLLVYFTDLCGDFPEKAPSYPTLWVATDKNYTEVPFGTVLSLQDHGWKPKSRY